MYLSNIHDLHLPQRFEDFLHRRFLFDNLLDNFYLGGGFVTIVVIIFLPFPKLLILNLAFFWL